MVHHSRGLARSLRKPARRSVMLPEMLSPKHGVQRRPSPPAAPEHHGGWRSPRPNNSTQMRPPRLMPTNAVLTPIHALRTGRQYETRMARGLNSLMAADAMRSFEANRRERRPNTQKLRPNSVS